MDVDPTRASAHYSSAHFSFFGLASGVVFLPSRTGSNESNKVLRRSSASSETLGLPEENREHTTLSTIQRGTRAEVPSGNSHSR
jgi:hypothetical protein